MWVPGSTYPLHLQQQARITSDSDDFLPEMNTVATANTTITPTAFLSCILNPFPCTIVMSGIDQLM